MEIARLQMTLDASKAVEQTRLLFDECKKTGDAFDAMSRRANQAMARIVAPIRGINGEFRSLQSAASTTSGQIAAMATSGARNIDTLRQQVNLTTHSFQQMGAAAGTAASSISSSFNGINTTITRTASGFNRLAGVFGVYLSAQGAKNMADSLIDAQIASQRLEQTMTLTTGSAQGAKDQIATLRMEANRAGNVFIETATSFAKFQSAARDTAITSAQLKNIFTSVSDASARLHLDASTTQHVFLALEQMISKGVVSMEELRRQLGNALPGAFQIAARSMSMTTAEFMKLVESGQLLSAEFLPKFAEQLQKDIPLGTASDSLTASLNRLKNSWLELKTVVGDGIDFKGMSNFVGRGVQGVADSLEAARLLEQNGGGTKTEGMFNLLRGGLPGSYHRYANAQNYGELTPEQRAEILGKEFPFAPPVDLEYKQNRAGVRAGAKDFDFLKEYQRMKALNPMGEEYFHETNPPYGPPAPEAEKPITDKQKEAMKELIALRDKLTTTSLTGLEKEEAQIDINLRKQLEAIEKLTKETDGMEDGGGYNDIVAAMSAAGVAKQNARSKDADKKNAELMKEQAEEARDLTAAYQKLAAIEETATTGGLSGRDRELAEANKKWRDQYSTLIEINETLNVQESTYQAINKQLETSVKQINEKYDRSYVGEGSLVELSRRRLSLEKELLALKEDAPGSAAEAKRIQDQISSTEKQINLKLSTNDASAADAFIYGWQKAGQKFGTIAEGIAQTGEGLANSLSNNITDSLMDMINGTKSVEQAFADMARAIVADLLRVMIQQLIIRGLMAAFGGAGGSSYGGGGSSTGVGGVSGGVSSSGYDVSGFAHSGAVIGGGLHGSSMAIRRMHGGGVTEDEVPIIARKGEGVFTPEQMAAMGQMASGTSARPQKIEIINVVDPRMIDEHLAANPNAILNVVNRNKGQLRRMLLA
jgi:tape measure domain-containing protein